MIETFTEISKRVQVELRANFPGHPVSVRRDPDDDYILCVYVFCVPTGSVGAVEDSAYNICERLLDGSEYIAVVLVKDEQRTREYYPEYLPQKEKEPVLVVNISSMLDTYSENLAWQEVPTLPICIPPSRILCSSDMLSGEDHGSSYQSRYGSNEFPLPRGCDVAKAA